MLDNIRSELDAKEYKIFKEALDRLPTEIQDRVRTTSQFRICFIPYEGGRFEDVRNIDYLAIIDRGIFLCPRWEAIYTIAHEIAHWIIYDPIHLHLSEAEADAKLVEWGFQEEVKKVGYQHAREERAGEKIGYCWAVAHHNSSDMKTLLHYRERWNTGSNSEELIRELTEIIDPFSIIQISENLDPDVVEDIFEGRDKLIASPYFLKGIIYGVMKFINQQPTLSELIME